MKLNDFGGFRHNPGGAERWDFLIAIIKERGYKAVCEVGVVGGERGSDFHPGLNARMLLTYCTFDVLLLVDVVNQREMWDALYDTKAVYMQIGSIAASKLIADRSLDLVFIDGDHSAVDQDIIAWFPKVREGGILCGHDYTGWRGVDLMVDALIPDVYVNEKCDVWLREITPGLALCGEDSRIA